MLKALSLVLFAAIGAAIAPILASPLPAQTQQPGGNLDIMVHLDTHNPPGAAHSRALWFMLIPRDRATQPDPGCDCKLVVYDRKQRTIAQFHPLEVAPVVSDRRVSPVIHTVITFPKPGAYTVVLTGRATDGSFGSFALKYPVNIDP